jgi:nitrogenase molybdenum-iron protein alpha chain
MNMAVNLALPSAEVREKRLKGIISYNGTAKDLAEKSHTKSLSIKERTYGQCSDCSQTCAGVLSYEVRGAAVVEHSPIGCSMPAPTTMLVNVANKSRGLPPQSVNVISTNLTEKDTVYGGIEKLNETVREAKRRFNPTAIFIQSSCAAGIIGDDIESAADSLQEELGIPVVPVFCEGFKSRVWSSGFDAVFHGIMRKIVKEPIKKQPDLVNVFNFEGTDTYTPLLTPLGLRVNYVVALAGVEQLQELAEAACSAHICETLATYPAKALEQYYGVPEVKSPPPYGIKWTDEWLREIAKLTGKTDLVEEYISKEHKRIEEPLAVVREKLKGKKLYILAGDSYAHSIASMLKDLGVEIIGVTTLHHDQITDGGSENADSLSHLVNTYGDLENFSVCNKQPYQVYKILQKLKPDIMIVRHINIGVVAAKLGIPTINDSDVNITAGYDGVVRLGERLLQTTKAKKLYQNIARHYETPYSDWWLEQDDPFYFEGGAK